MQFNPALNLQAFSSQSVAFAPPAINAIYLRDGKYDNNMKRSDVAATFQAFRAQTATSRLALFFHGGLVDKAWGQQGAANQYDHYKDVVFPLFFIWESGFWEVLAHHFPLIFAETIFGRVLDHVLNLISSKTQQAQGTAASNRFALLASSFNDTDAQLRTTTLTDSDIAGFMEAIKNDVAIQQEAAAIARTSQGIDSLLAKSATRAVLQLSPRTYLSPDVVSAIRGAYVQANRNNIDNNS
jgi:hypothetical protein